MFGVKQQTVKKKLKRIFENGLFPELRKLMLDEFPNLDESHFDQLQKELEADARKEPVFRRIGQEIAKEWHERAWEKKDFPA